MIILASLSVLLLAVLIVLTIRNNNHEVEDHTGELKDLLKDENFKLNKKITDEYSELRVKIAESIGNSSKENIADLNKFKDALNKELLNNFSNLNKNINDQMEGINKKVEFRLNEGFEKTNKTFENIVVRLTKIDEAQKNIKKLSEDVVSLQEVLTDKKTRGTFGEVQLNNILESIFGVNNTRIYETQYQLSNKKMVDAILHVPDPMGDLAIDSKFPLENYQRMVDKDLTEAERNTAKKQFKADLKKHINDIADKYIIPTVTAEQAVMFIPAEAIFAEINAYHQDIIEYSQKKHVWIASPTTIMSLLTTVQVIIQQVERNDNMRIIQDELVKLGEEFKRYKVRWDKLSRNIKTVSKTVDEIETTSTKIGKRFDAISAVELDQDEIDTIEHVEQELIE